MISSHPSELGLSPDAEKLRAAVARYCSEERHPSRPAFVVHGPYVASQVREFRAAWNAGCYVIYGPDGGWRYIGESAQVGWRVLNHFSERTQNSTFWLSGTPAHFIDIVEVGKPWERFSLEQYLYAHLSSHALT